MNREQWQTKRGRYADMLPSDSGMGRPVIMWPVTVDRLGAPVPANDALMRHEGAMACCEKTPMAANEPSLQG